ncbi:hypothetical protein OPT61_g1815 [Boeremia exigua]|uniref:Uncharacterized protein n=1 Tax=Boeremia exigua TaxID=749465 RepID=A0ACC2INS2_9PLEO|nr:hypothetical protein OPT61_g1815 [Boeremia exigua]
MPSLKTARLRFGRMEEWVQPIAQEATGEPQRQSGALFQCLSMLSIELCACVALHGGSDTQIRVDLRPFGSDLGVSAGHESNSYRIPTGLDAFRQVSQPCAMNVQFRWSPEQYFPMGSQPCRLTKTTHTDQLAQTHAARREGRNACIAQCSVMITRLFKAHISSRYGGGDENSRTSLKSWVVKKRRCKMLFVLGNVDSDDSGSSAADAIEGRPWAITAACTTVLAAYYLTWLIYSRTLHPLAKVPGPVWASLSRTWLMWRMYHGDYQFALLAQHKLHGSLIRIAPNELSYANPDGIRVIYRLHAPLEKTDWYHTWKGRGIKLDMFTITSEKEHAAYRRVVGGVYTLSSILKNEPQIDDNVATLLDRLDGFAQRSSPVDLGLWLEMYAYENIGSVFFGKPFGFLATSTDYGGYIAAVHKAMPLLSVVSMAPSYARTALLVAAAAMPSLLRAVLAVDSIRRNAVRETEEAMARKTDAQRHDMLTRLLEIVAKTGSGSGVTHHEIMGEMWVAVLAGADSTACALRAVVYHLLKNPSAMRKLTAEIDAAYADGALSHPAQHAQVIRLPYLMAVCQEAARVWPSFQITMPRRAPVGGLYLPSGFFVPAGYGVGMNPYVSQRDKGVFGEDAECFRPERWLSADKEQLRQMNAAMLSFGAGTRTCTGQHLAMAEIYKIVPEMLHRFAISMPADKQWTTFNASFNLTGGVVCSIERRDSVA